MNHFSIGAQKVPGGYIGFFRRVHKAENEVIMGKGNVPILFGTRAEAKAAAGEHMCDYLNGNFVRDGEIIKARSEAEKLFKPIYRKGRVIQVERVGE